MKEYGVHVGRVQSKMLSVDWRKLNLPDEPDDDAPLKVTPPDVVGMLGFDPLDLDVKKLLVDDTALRTLYVSRPLLNGGDIRAWAAEQGLRSTLPASDMHATIAFSRKAVDWSTIQPDPQGLTIAGGARSVHQFPAGEDSTKNGAVVLRFESPMLQKSLVGKRWQAFIDAGASWDHPEYQPHITLTYALDSLPDLKPYRGPLMLGPEKFTDVNEGWADDIKEVPL